MVNSENIKHLEHTKKDVASLREQQANNIDEAFDQVIGKLEEKREQLKVAFTKDYATERLRFEDKSGHLDHNCDQISQINMIF